MADAERIYRQILAADPSHFDSLHLLGILAHQVGRHDAAIDLIGRAIARNDRVPECHYNMGLALAAAGRMQDAAAAFAKAIALKSDYAEAHMNLGNAYKSLGRGDEAIASFECALALKPNVPELHYNLANVRAEKGDLDGAKAGYERALALKADYAEAHGNLAITLMAQGRSDQAWDHHRRALVLDPNLVQALVSFGNVLMTRGRLEDAVATYQQAIARKPDYAEAHCNLASIRMRQGRDEEALVSYRRALAIDPDLAVALINVAKLLLNRGNQVQAFEFVKRAVQQTQSDETKELFARCVRNLEATTPSEENRVLVTRALMEGWGRPKEFARFALSLVKRNPDIAICIRKARAVYPRQLSAHELIGAATLKAVASDQLLRCVMESTRAQDADVELFLTAARALLLDLVANSSAQNTDDQLLAFYCSLARQCFINEYVFANREEESERLQALRDSVGAAIESGETLPALHLVAVAAYGPLEAVPRAERLLQRSWPEPVATLLVQQVKEPLEERQYRSSMSRLTDISDRVSVAVKGQYEENPYPRWITPAPSGALTTIDTYLRRFAPTYRHPENGCDLLFAGCGTGQEVIESARKFTDVRILAVDLSLTSLGYAQRKAHEHGVTGVEFAQADILELGSIGRSFDAIESNGVLHHMAEPMKGWRVLLSLLRPGGIMHIGLYSALARRDIVAARTFIAQGGYRATFEDIRRCRVAMMAAGDGTPLKDLTKIGDFFSLSECRDLLFHVQEHQLSLPEIKRFLQEEGLQFLGFDIDETAIEKFRVRFPSAEVTDLDHWHIFETENPNTFSSMYQFFVQKPCEQ